MEGAAVSVGVADGAVGGPRGRAAPGAGEAEMGALGDGAPLLAHCCAAEEVREREEGEDVLVNLVWKVLPDCRVEVAVTHPGG